MLVTDQGETPHLPGWVSPTPLSGLTDGETEAGQWLGARFGSILEIQETLTLGQSEGFLGPLSLAPAPGIAFLLPSSGLCFCLLLGAT